MALTPEQREFVASIERSPWCWVIPCAAILATLGITRYSSYLADKAIEQRRETVARAFSAYDIDTSGILEPSEKIRFAERAPLEEGHQFMAKAYDSNSWTFEDFVKYCSNISDESLNAVLREIKK